MNSESLKNMYDDFFGSPLVMSSDEEKEIKKETTIDIDSLLIDDESKELLKKIIKYMKDYSESKVTNYIPFNIIINSNNTETINSIVDILKASSIVYVANSKKELSGKPVAICQNILKNLPRYGRI